METNQLPRRSERHKRKETSSQLLTAFVLGTCWTLFTLTPEPWRSQATYIIIGTAAIYLSSRLDTFKCSTAVKWTLALVVYVIGFILYIL
ncbi:hypothetical protein C2I27_14115 [Priestia megaterium]|uniref:hypothetical protein n=1 Tax=Priestia TaxID=2800373 RepID=UPI000D50BFEA|nr:hypothetical protein [Priestia megaterium]MBU8851559.1 hypothetical protein [Bacillus sp. FJAT-26377]PVC69244.1 hypothetical protein C2I27_14115 [Priestia megaterium]